MSLLIKDFEAKSLHFVGLFGIGMSAIAQFLAKELIITGSDRGMGSESVSKVESGLRELGITISSQDGSGVTKECDAIVVSTAIEESNPDYKKALELGIKIIHRSEVLAAIVNRHRTISVTGTSGKSSVSAMIFHTLKESGIDASYIGGANLHSLREKGLIGNAYRGSSPILVIEADESDGSVVQYHPDTTVLLNISRDHKEITEIVALLKVAADQSKRVVKNGEDIHLKEIDGITYSVDNSGEYLVDSWSSSSRGVEFSCRGVEFSIPFAGRHTVSNAMATIATLSQFDIPLNAISKALKNYSGIERRFDIYQISNNSRVIDDYAHNPEKITAAIRAAQEFGESLTVIFQPHGFGPLRFMFDDLCKVFEGELRDSDRAFILPPYYAGGTVDRSIESSHVAAKVKKISLISREEIVDRLSESCRVDETVLLLGARDPSLPQLAKDIQVKLKDKQ